MNTNILIKISSLITTLMLLAGCGTTYYDTSRASAISYRPTAPRTTYVSSGSVGTAVVTNGYYYPANYYRYNYPALTLSLGAFSPYYWGGYYPSWYYSGYPRYYHFNHYYPYNNWRYRGYHPWRWNGYRGSNRYYGHRYYGHGYHGYHGYHGGGHFRH